MTSGRPDDMPANLNPGGLWRRILNDEGIEIDSGPIRLDGARELAGVDARAVISAGGGRALVYDGDTGALVASVRTWPA